MLQAAIAARKPADAHVSQILRRAFQAQGAFADAQAAGHRRREYRRWAGRIITLPCWPTLIIADARMPYSKVLTVAISGKAFRNNSAIVELFQCHF